jgi:hypothetical protein
LSNAANDEWLALIDRFVVALELHGETQVEYVRRASDLATAVRDVADACERDAGQAPLADAIREAISPDQLRSLADFVDEASRKERHGYLGTVALLNELADFFGESEESEIAPKSDKQR